MNMTDYVFIQGINYDKKDQINKVENAYYSYQNARYIEDKALHSESQHLQFKYAIDSCNINLLKRTIKSAPEIVNQTSPCFSGVSGLFYAISCGNQEALKEMLEAGADIDTVCTKTGETAISQATLSGNTNILEMLLKISTKHINTITGTVAPIHSAVMKKNGN